MALEYRPQSMPAPIVVAKGIGALAQRIKETARWHDIPIVENPPLAQALYRATEVGRGHSGQVVRGGGRNSGVSVSHASEFARGRQAAAAAAAGPAKAGTEMAETTRAGASKAPAVTGSLPVATVVLVFVMIVPVPAFAAGPAAGHEHHAGRDGVACRRCTFCGRRNFPCSPRCCCS